MSKHLKKRNKLFIPVIAASMLFGAVPAMAAEQPGSPKLAMAAGSSNTLSDVDSSYITAAEQFLTTVFGLTEVKFGRNPIPLGDNQWMLSFQSPGDTANDSDELMANRPNIITINKDGSIEYATMELVPDGARPASFELVESTLRQLDSEGKTKLKNVLFSKKQDDLDDHLQFTSDYNQKTEPFGVVAINSSDNTVYKAQVSTRYPAADAEQKYLPEAERVLKELSGKDHVEITGFTNIKSLLKDKVKETWGYSYENDFIAFDANTGKIKSLYIDLKDDSADAAPDLESKERAIAIANPYMINYFGIDLTGYEAKYTTILSGPGQIGLYNYTFSQEGEPDVMVLFTGQGGVKSISLN
ncbi:hypothetical protein YDYSG_56250 [Paenibacillus tyrfis]|uniref:hypothetical protein n=1 Tax=Paenibacillus tyrfis TaxID=1501230 RepID=UPI0024905586|nr:hypothetical protein [Paenibacillus tyrfis]GLI09593.1 hypothetical protein YDYSG_56250 [Paenibacillus tyrfis]